MENFVKKLFLKKFKLILHGYFSTPDEINYHLPFIHGKKVAGFFATRIIVSNSLNSATSIAEENIYDDLRKTILKNLDSITVEINLESYEVMSIFLPVRGPKKGYTFYTRRDDSN